MGLYFQVAPGLKLRLTKSGVRAGVGPRAARLWVGAGGPGVSSGAGPFTMYQGLGGRSRRRGPPRTSMATYQRQVRQAQQADDIRRARSTLRGMLTIHQHDFEEATR